MVSGTLLQIIGFGFAFLMCIGLIAVLAAGDRSGRQVAIVVGLLAVGGIAIGAKGRKLIKESRDTKRYIHLIVNEGRTSIDEIAAILGRSDAPAVMGEIQELIEAGFLRGYSVDRNRRIVGKLVIADAPPRIQQNAGAPAVQTVAFTCRGCGARNEASAAGNTARCEFCDTPNTIHR